MSDAKSTASPRVLSAMAAELYTRGPLLMRLLQRYRPFICPFEHLLPWVPEGATVLDIGCGGGLFLALLSQIPGRLRLGVGFDAAAGAIEVARAANPPRCRFEHVDVAAPWPAEPAKFEVVSIIDVMHHVPPAAQPGLIRTAAARVAPEGILLYKDMCRRPAWRALANRAHDLLLARQWITYAPVESVEQWAAEAGLRLEHASFHARFWYGHELQVFRRVGPAGAGLSAAGPGEAKAGGTQ
ncbi:MAG: class I SAM-dependent methyltransferase [Phycisphaerae bacterium]|nr:class I SAM-dependent methyltransferase [Phycisphaerae bacterium]